MRHENQVAKGCVNKQDLLADLRRDPFLEFQMPDVLWRSEQPSGE